jgi:multiple antibiotic resistance protein
MFAILNPIGNVVIFMGLAGNYSNLARRSLAIRSSIAIAVILVVTIWAGEMVLSFFGVALHSLQAAGGVVIALIALSMLHSSQSAIHDSNSDADDKVEDIAIVPLAMPMVAGPGAIVTIIVNTHKFPGMVSNLTMSVVCIGLAAFIAFCFLMGQPLTRLLGQKGLDVLTKFMGLILLSIAFGMFGEGAKGMFPGLAG